jgi:acetyltransferase-like isoleucine patch superfamily enzyme
MKFVRHIEVAFAWALSALGLLFMAVGQSRLIVFMRRVYWRSRLGGMGQGCYIYSNVVIHSPKLVILGNRVSMVEFVHIWGGGEVRIGDDVMIASHCAITSQTHNVDPSTRREVIFKPVVIEDNVWIGSGATILPGVSIGKNSVIAAGSVVTHDVPSNTLVKGVPAKVCRAI